MDTVPASLNCARDAVEDVGVPVPARWVHQENALSARTMTPVHIRTEHITTMREYRTMTPPLRAGCKCCSLENSRNPRGSDMLAALHVRGVENGFAITAVRYHREQTLA